MNKRAYFEPCVEVLDIEIEAGFGTSDGDTLGLPGEEPNFNDFGDF